MSKLRDAILLASGYNVVRSDLSPLWDVMKEHCWSRNLSMIRGIPMFLKDDLEIPLRTISRSVNGDIITYESIADLKIKAEDYDVLDFDSLMNLIVDWQLCEISEPKIFENNNSKFDKEVLDLILKEIGSSNIYIVDMELDKIRVVTVDDGKFHNLPTYTFRLLNLHNKIVNKKLITSVTDMDISIEDFLDEMCSLGLCENAEQLLEKEGYKPNAIKYAFMATNRRYQGCKDLKDVISKLLNYAYSYTLDHQTKEELEAKREQEMAERAKVGYYHNSINYPGSSKGYESNTCAVASLFDDKILIKRYGKLLWSGHVTDINMVLLPYQLDWYNAYGYKLEDDGIDESIEIKILSLGKSMCEYYDLLHGNVHLLEESLTSALVYKEGSEHVLRVPRIATNYLWNNKIICSAGEKLKYGLFAKRTRLDLIKIYFGSLERASEIINISDIPEGELARGDLWNDWLKNHPFEKYIGVSFAKRKLEEPKPEKVKESIDHPKFYHYEWMRGKIELMAKKGITVDDINEDFESIKTLIESMLNKYAKTFNVKRENIVVGDVKYLEDTSILLIPVKSKNYREQKEPHVINPLWED